MLVTKKDIKSVELELNNTKNEVNKLKEQLSDIKNHQTELFSQFNSKVDILTNHFETLENSSITNFKNHTNEFEQLNLKLKKRIDSMLMLENILRNSFMESATSEIKKQISSLDITTKEYKKVESTLLNLNSNIKTLTNDITKFKSISSEISIADFNLSKHVKEVNLADKEKLRLMNENDRLKTIIAKQRRHR
jgi:hypothetical protein